MSTQTEKRPALLALETAFFLATLVFTLYVRLNSPGLTPFFSDHSREFVRMFEWLDGKPSSWLGQEIMMDQVGRTPGPANYLIMAGLWSVLKSVTGMISVLHAFTIITIVGFSWFVVRPLGRAPFWFFWLTFSLMPTQVLISRTIWTSASTIPVNLTMLILLWGYQRYRTRRWLLGFYLFGAMAIQVYLLALLPFIAGTLWIRLISPSWPRICLWASSLTLVWLSVWNFCHGNVLNALFSRTHAPMGPGFSWSRVWDSAGHHFWLQSGPSPTLNYCTVPMQLGHLVDPQARDLISAFTGLGPLSLLLSLLSIAWILGNFFHPRLKKLPDLRPLESLLLIWLALGLSGLANYLWLAGAFPIRYGQALHPFQFLAVCLALNRLARSNLSRFIKTGLTWFCLSLALVAFAGNAYFLLFNFRVCSTLGRVSLATTPVPELPLSHKLELLKKSDPSLPPEKAMATLHGPVAHRLRFFEFENWDNSVWMGGLSQTLQRSLPYRESAPTHYFVALPSTGSEPPRPVPEQIPLKPEWLPMAAELYYFDSEGELLQSRSIPDLEPILPLLDAPHEAVTVRVEFQIAASPDAGDLLIGYDDSPMNRALSLLEVKLQGANVSMRETGPPFWLDQRVALVMPPDTDFRCQLTFEIHSRRKYSRVDIFRLPSRLSRPVREHWYPKNWNKDR